MIKTGMTIRFVMADDENKQRYLKLMLDVIEVFSEGTVTAYEDPIVDWETEFKHEHVYEELGGKYCHYTAPTGEMCGHIKEDSNEG
jgi:hypothetical protein